VWFGTYNRFSHLNINMSNKTRNKINSEFGIGSLSPILCTLGIITYYFSSIVVDAKNVLDISPWIGVGITSFGWYIGNKYSMDFGAKIGKIIVICFVVISIIMTFTVILKII